jgi:hypothetical protein
MMNFLKRLFKGIPIHGFVSEIDIFMAKYRKEYPKKSASQQREIERFRKLCRLRDHAPRN